jgi:hypothetical protein
MSVVRRGRKDTQSHNETSSAGFDYSILTDLKKEIESLKEEVSTLKLKEGPKGDTGVGERGPKGPKGDVGLPLKIELDKLEDGMGLVWSSKKKAFISQKIFEE